MAQTEKTFTGKKSRQVQFIEPDDVTDEKDYHETPGPKSVKPDSGARAQYLYSDHWKVAQSPVKPVVIDAETVRRLKREQSQRFVEKVCGQDINFVDTPTGLTRLSSSPGYVRVEGRRYGYLLAQHWRLRGVDDEINRSRKKQDDLGQVLFTNCNSGSVESPVQNDPEPTTLFAGRKKFGTRAEFLCTEHWRPVQLSVNGRDPYLHTFYLNRVLPWPRNYNDELPSPTVGSGGCGPAALPSQQLHRNLHREMSGRFLHLYQSHWLPRAMAASTANVHPPPRIPVATASTVASEAPLHVPQYPNTDSSAVGSAQPREPEGRDSAAEATPDEHEEKPEAGAAPAAPAAGSARTPEGGGRSAAAGSAAPGGHPEASDGTSRPPPLPSAGARGWWRWW